MKSSAKIIQAARDLRKGQTQAEKILWNILRDRQFKNFKFRRQHPLGRFIADFFCHEAKLVIELDGSIHQLKDQKEYDVLRTNIMSQFGLKILRFKNEEVVSDTNKVLKRIKRELTLPPRPSPDRRGVGGEGFSLIETLIGISLIFLVFVSIFGMVQLGIKLIAQSKARTIAVALANQKIELGRNLPYDKVGTKGGIPNGSIPETETIVRNKITYTVKTTVVYIDDSFDNIFPSDPLPTDYKRIKVKVSWSGFWSDQIFLQTDIVSKGVETSVGGGIISILVFDANGQVVPWADIQLENDSSSPPINVHYQTNDQGRFFIPGVPSCNDCYKITVAKTGYSLERTYALGESVGGKILATPNKPFLSVLEGQISEVSFTIDKLSTKNIETIKYIEEKTWSDSFDDENKISEKFQVVASSTGALIQLEKQDEQYLSSGYLLSATATPTNLVEWSRMNWSDDIPVSTEIKYQILYFTSGNWVLIPDADLTVDGITNSQGFSDSPIDLSGLDSFKYPFLELKANFSTDDPAVTPTLFDWQITWFSSEVSTPVPNVSFTMRGAKTLGLDSEGQPVYKYQNNLSTDNSGQKIISNLEWDSYRVTINGSATGYDIANSLPPQPVSINPDTTQNTILRLANHQANTLLITVKDSGGQSLAGAGVHLYKSGYDKTKLTTSSGQSFFTPLSQASYNLEVKMTGYQDWLSQVDVSGQSEQIIILTPP